MVKTTVLFLLLVIFATACGQASSDLPTGLPATTAPPMATSALPANTPTTRPPEHTPTVAVTSQPKELPVITIENANHLARITVLVGHTDRVTDLAFSGDGAFLASTGYEQKIILWDTSIWQQVTTFPILEADLNTIAFSPVGTLLASGQTVWDASTGETVHTLLENIAEPIHVAFSPDGSRMAADARGRIKVWDVATWEEVLAFTAPAETHWLFSISFSPDGKWLAAGSGQNGTVYIWSAETGELAVSLDQGNENDIHDIAFTPDGTLLAAGGTDYFVRLWDVSTAEKLHELPIIGMYSLAISPDGAMLATAGPDCSVKLWDVQTGKLLRSLPHADELMAVAFSPDGRLIAAGGYDNTIVIWGIAP